jgi:hypothetical protein
MTMRDACDAGKAVEKKKKEIHAAVKQMCTSMVVDTYMSICRRSSLSHHQPASQTALCFCEEDNHLIVERSLLDSLSRLKEKDSACACLFSPRLKVEDSDHALLCIVKMLNQQNRPHTIQHMSFL